MSDEFSFLSCFRDDTDVCFFLQTSVPRLLLNLPQCSLILFLFFFFFFFFLLNDGNICIEDDERLRGEGGLL